MRADLTEQLTGENAPYNLVFTTNGIACTTATVIAATLGITDSDTIDDIDRIRRAHLLLAMFNALQPGVFALSGMGSVRHADTARRPTSPSSCVVATPAGSTAPPTT